jgi:hypothetical protein
MVQRTGPRRNFDDGLPPEGMTQTSGLHLKREASP